MNNIKLDSANITLNTNSKLDNVVINLKDQVQDVALSITRLDGATNTGTIKYDSILGGFTSDLQLWSGHTNWMPQSLQGRIPTPTFDNVGATFVVADPSNPNPKTVDQNGLVSQNGFHFMEGEVDVVMGEFHNSVINGSGANVDSQTQRLGYVAKFRDTVTNTMHAIFIDGRLASTTQEAIAQAKLLIENQANWDAQVQTPQLKNFFSAQKLNVSDVNNDPTTDTKGPVSAYDTLVVNSAGVKLDYHQDGTFDHLVGLSSDFRTSISVEEHSSTSGKQIFIIVDENERATSQVLLNGQPIDPDNGGALAGTLDFSLFSDPELASPELLKLLTDAGVTETDNMALVGFKEVEDKNSVLTETLSPAPILMSRSISHNPAPAPAPAPATNPTIPALMLANGRTLQLTPTTLPQYLKVQWLSDYEHKGGQKTDPMYLFMKQLVVSYDVNSGKIVIVDNSNGKFGYKVDQINSQLDFASKSQVDPVFIEIVNPSFVSNVQMTIHSQTGDIQQNFGSVIYDQLKAHWTGNDVNIRGTVQKGLVTPKDFTQHSSSLKFESSQTSPTHKPRFVLTTDGSFKPLDANDLTWKQDPKNPNIWYGEGKSAEFTDIMPSNKNTIKIEAQTIIKPVDINVNVVDGLNNTNLGTSNTIHLNVDLFTNNIKANGDDLNSLKNFKVNGKNVLEAIGLDEATLSKMLRTNQVLTQSILDSSALKINHNFLYLGSSVHVQNNVPVLTIKTSTPLTHALLSNPSNAHFGPNSGVADLSAILHQITIKIKDTHGHVLATAHAMQDPVTNEIILVDAHNHPIHLNQHIKTQILTTIKNQIATQFGISLLGSDATKYDFKRLYVKDSHGHTLSSVLSGDAYKSTI